jgi:glutathione S-transferase
MSQIVLYYSPGACSLAVHIALYEWGKPFETRRVMLANREHHAPDMLAINPHARIPFMTIDRRPVREVSGMLTWIGQQAGLYPEAGSYDAARCGEWLGWMTSAVHISFAMIWRGERFLDDEPLYPLLRARGLAWLRPQLAEIEQRLASARYVLGDSYSVADCNVLPFYRWFNRVGFDMAAEAPAWTAHTKRLCERAAVRAALEAEGIDIFESTLDPRLAPTR